MEESNEVGLRKSQSLADSLSDKGSVRQFSEPPEVLDIEDTVGNGVTNAVSPSLSVEREGSTDPSLHDVMSLSSDHNEKPDEALSADSVSKMNL